jgi:hypothetical protein
MTLAGAPLSVLGPAFAVLGSGLVALYVLKLRRRRVEVPFADLWRRVLRDVESTALWKRLKQLLSLALQLTLLALLLFAIGDPRLQTSKSGRTVAIVLDTSASMQAHDGRGATRMSQAIEAARRELRGLGGGDEALLISMDARPTPLTGLTNDDRELARALDGVHASDSPADLIGALRLAAASLRGRPHPTLVLIGDGAWTPSAIDHLRLSGAAQLDEVDLSGVDVRYQPVGTPADNLAITAFAVRRYRANQTAYEVLVEVQRFSVENTTGKVPFQLELVQDGEVVNVERLELGPGEKLQRLYPNLAGEGTQLEAVLRKVGPGRLDALDVDDRAYALLPARKKVKVLLVSSGNLFLEGALLLDENLEVKKTAPAAYAAADARSFDAVVFDGFVPEAPPPTNALYLDPHGESSPFAVKGELADPIVTETASTHPLMRWVTLKDLNISRASRFQLKPGDVAVASSLREPILVAREEGGRKLVAFGFDLRKSDLPMRVAFPVLVVNAIDWFAGADTGLMASYSTAQPWRLTAPAGASELEVRGPDGHATRLPVRDGRATFTATRVGYYELTAPGAPRRLIAANLTSPAESALLTRRELVAHGQTLRPPEPGRAGMKRTIWSYLLLAVLLLTLFEWLTYNRRVTV